jgi:hypothetical protein
MSKRFRDLTPAQEAAFERIAINEEPQCSRKTIAALKSAGLIAEYEEVIGADAFGAIIVPCYEVPTPVHIEWCAWCETMYENENNPSCAHAPDT